MRVESEIPTTAEFLDELARIEKDFEWYLTKQKHIRARLKASVHSLVFDPVTAVAYHRTKQPYSPKEWLRAATEIGLAIEACAEIVSAFSYDWDPDCRQGNLRQHLLRTVLPMGHEALAQHAMQLN
jgi:hypothetical protein